MLLMHHQQVQLSRDISLHNVTMMLMQQTLSHITTSFNINDKFLI
uniref:Uncharacterized protein n=1 Tax=Arundo donax TaxID=35708 RepID=A0A0A8Y3H5_ARUDO